ncbi:MAG: Txe/YoeB family addiction module toxin [Alphaproteobacteria bacterium]|nr:Txe/YoeB family addiction module toxin [Alphaproteobacteria bacterium]
MYKIRFTKQALKDAKKVKEAGLKEKVTTILNLLEADPYYNPPPYEKLLGNLKGSYSRRINIQHRIVYQVRKKEGIVNILRMWTHYE